MKRIYTDAQKLRNAEYQRRYRTENRESVLQNNRKCERRRKFKRYGITEEIYNTILSDQNGRCGICKTSNSGARDWHVDHCHSSGKVRGILCHHCNLMLGNAKDSPETLRAAIQYLENTI